jgi:hypothetical protein
MVLSHVNIALDRFAQWLKPTAVMAISAALMTALVISLDRFDIMDTCFYCKRQ